MGKRQLMTRISGEDALGRLKTVMMDVGEWNRIVDFNAAERFSVTLDPPHDARELFVFSMHLARWLPRGDWVVVCFDNSTLFSRDEELLIDSVSLCGEGQTYWPILLNGSKEVDEQFMLVQLSNLIFLLIIFEAHAQVVSSESKSGDMIDIFDGTVLLSARRAFELTDSWLGDPNRAPLQLPQWAL